MRPGSGPAILVAALLAVAACGGNVIVDGTGTTTGTAGSTSSTSGGTTSGTCRTTCLEALKEGGGVCNTETTAGMDYTSVMACGNQSCNGQCPGFSGAAADAACFDCLAGSCAFELMACTGN